MISSEFSDFVEAFKMKMKMKMKIKKKT